MSFLNFTYQQIAPQSMVAFNEEIYFLLIPAFLKGYIGI